MGGANRKQVSVHNGALEWLVKDYFAKPGDKVALSQDGCVFRKGGRWTAFRRVAVPGFGKVSYLLSEMERYVGHAACQLTVAGGKSALIFEVSGERVMLGEWELERPDIEMLVGDASLSLEYRAGAIDGNVELYRRGTDGVSVGQFNRVRRVVFPHESDRTMMTTERELLSAKLSQFGVEVPPKAEKGYYQSHVVAAPPLLITAFPLDGAEEYIEVFRKLKTVELRAEGPPETARDLVYQMEAIKVAALSARSRSKSSGELPRFTLQ